MSGMKNRKVLIVVSIMVILILIFGVGFIRINNKYQNPEEEEYAIGKPADFDGIEITVLDREWVEIQDFISRYDINEETFLKDSDAKVMMLKVRYKNSDPVKKSIEIYLDTLETLGWSNGILLEGFQAANPSGSTMSVELEANSQIELLLPFMLYEVQFQKKVWDKIQQEPFRFVISLYPVKKSILVN